MIFSAFRPRSLAVPAVAWLALSLLAAAQPAQAVAQAAPPVTVTDDGTSWVLANGYLSATINKRTGDMTSLKVNGLETQGYVSGHHAGYWEQNPSGAARLVDTVTIDPASNDGALGEVSVKGYSDGKNLNGERARRDPDFPEGPPAKATGAEPGEAAASGPALPPGVERNRGTRVNRRPGPPGPGLLVDMEIRYTLARGAHGIYTYAIFTHEPSYGATEIGESRYGMKLNGKLFDWLSVDAQRDGPMPNGYDWDHGTDLNMKEARRLTTGVKKGQVEHKYDYCADQFDTPAYGWASTTEHVGIYFINPSMEFLSSGPNHFELTGHLDDGDGGDPTLLDYWRGTHYGGSSLPLADGEAWTKVAGPVMIYVNHGATPEAMFADAKQQATLQAAQWPYAWVDGVDYTPAAERSTVTGRLLLNDPQAPGTALPNLKVGLAYPDQPVTEPVPGERPPERLTWQNDAKHYEFWTHGTPDGRFSIANVRPGTYELHAIADGVLGEYARATITIPPATKADTQVDLGTLNWRPVRYGLQLFQIGIPNRSAAEFLHGNDHWHWGEYLQYAKLFPHDVDFTVGQSDFRKDWFIYQVPHDEDAHDETGRGHGRATPWRIHFQLSKAPEPGQRGVLRLALAGVGARHLEVQVNGKDAGTVSGLVYNATINRDGVEGSWVEKDLVFPAELLHAGENTLVLTVPEGGIMNGLAYDTVRLELAPAAQ